MKQTTLKLFANENPFSHFELVLIDTSFEKFLHIGDILEFSSDDFIAMWSTQSVFETIAESPASPLSDFTAYVSKKPTTKFKVTVRKLVFHKGTFHPVIILQEI